MKENINPENNAPHTDLNPYKLGFFILFVVFIFLLGAVTSWYFFAAGSKSGFLPDNAAVSPTPILQEMQRLQTLPSAVVTQNIVPEAEAEIPLQSDFDLIREAMAERHGKAVDEVILTVAKNTGVHASGGVKFEGEMGGGWFLAAKSNGSWVIAADGNGTIPCAAIEPYDFPIDMAPSCHDETGAIHDR